MIKTTCSKCGGVRDGTHAGYCRLCYNTYKREWYQSNKEAEYYRNLAFRKTRPEIARNAMRKMRAANPAKDYEYRKAWRAANPERVRAHDANKRAKRRIAIADSKVSLEEWNAIKLWYGNKCAYCRAADCELTRDHVVPIASGGLHTAENIAPACRSCNSRKQAMPANEFMDKLAAEQ